MTIATPSSCDNCGTKLPVGRATVIDGEGEFCEGCGEVAFHRRIEKCNHQEVTKHICDNCGAEVEKVDGEWERA
jgi:predicted RNA-binding Zn-ribbon protein involved in translation (DUF1610 family)